MYRLIECIGIQFSGRPVLKFNQKPEGDVLFSSSEMQDPKIVYFGGSGFWE